MKMPTITKQKKARQDKGTVELDLSASFDVADAKEEDFDLDIEHSQYKGKKGQAGTRTT